MRGTTIPAGARLAKELEKANADGASFSDVKDVLLKFLGDLDKYLYWQGATVVAQGKAISELQTHDRKVL